MRRTAVPALAAAIAVCSVQSVAAQSVAAFYGDKTIEMIIGSTPGGTYDTWARMLTRHMGRHIPGNPGFLAKNMPGAGHIKAANYLFNVAPKDGTTIGIFSRNIPTRAILNHPAVKFKPEEFVWLGSPELTNRVCVAKAGAAVQKASDLFEKELIVGGAGAGTAVSTTPHLLRELLGMKFKLVEGYKGAPDVLLAMERGEVGGICQTVSGIENSHPGWIAEGKIKVLFNLESERVPGLDAPTIHEFARTEEQRAIIRFYSANAELGRPIVAPPGVPAERVSALRRAFDATMKDPKFKDEAKKQGLEIAPLTGEQLEARIKALSATTPAIVDKTEALLGPKKKKNKKKSAE